MLANSPTCTNAFVIFIIIIMIIYDSDDDDDDTNNDEQVNSENCGDVNDCGHKDNVNVWPDFQVILMLITIMMSMLMITMNMMLMVTLQMMVQMKCVFTDMKAGPAPVELLIAVLQPGKYYLQQQNGN